MLSNYITDKYSENYYGGNDYYGGEQICLDTSKSAFCWAILIFMAIGLFYLWKLVISPILFSKSNYISHLDPRAFLHEGIDSKNNHMKQSLTHRAPSGMVF